MKKYLLTLAFLLAAPFTQAQDYGFWGLNLQPPPTPPAVHLLKEADVLVANVTIVASKHNPEAQAADFANGLAVLRAAVGRNSQLSIKDERTVFGGGEPSVFASSYAGGRFNTRRSASDFKLLHPLNTGMDAAGAAEVLRRLVGALKLPSDVDIRIDSMQIEISDAESLRMPLLEAIASDATKLKTLFNGSDVIIGGLQSRIEQRPFNNHQVVVFLPYTLSIGNCRKN